MLTTEKKLFKNRLQLASFVSIHALMLAVELPYPELLPHCQVRGVLVEDLLQDGDNHVSAFVPWSIEVFISSFVKFRLGCNITSMCRHSIPELRNCFPDILLPAPALGAVDTVHHIGGPAVNGGVDSGHGRGLGGLDLLPFLDKVTCATIAISFSLAKLNQLFN